MKSKKHKGLLLQKEFAKWVLKYAFYSLMLLLTFISIGIFRYHYFGDLEYIYRFYNASMIFTGMGSVNEMKTEDAKLFASFYALFSGVIFLSTVAIFFMTIAQRLMYLLRIEELYD